MMYSGDYNDSIMPNFTASSLAWVVGDVSTMPGAADSDNLRKAMVRESEMFFETIVREDRSILDLLDADFTFVNGPLAKHYGIEGVSGLKFVRVKAHCLDVFQREVRKS